LQVLLDFLGGAVAANAIPHLVKGITGERHMTPFGRSSSAAVNVVWAFANVLGALLLLQLASRREVFAFPATTELAGPSLVAFLLGAFVTAIWLAIFWSDPNARLPWHRD
jgi:hypothetical protein